MNCDSLMAQYAAKYQAIKGDAIIKKMKLLGVAMPKVKLVDGTDAPDELFRDGRATYVSKHSQGKK